MAGINVQHTLTTSIKTILDKNSEKELRADLKDLLSDQNIDFNTEEFKKNIQVLGTMINKVLQQVGQQPIDLGKMIQMPKDDVWKRLGEIAASDFMKGWDAVAGSGMSASVLKLKNLQTEKQSLLERQTRMTATADKRRDRYEQFIELSMGDAEQDDIKGFSKINGNVADEAKRIADNYTQANKAFISMERGATGYSAALRKAATAAYDLMRMGKTLNANNGALMGQIGDNNVASMFDSETLAGTFEDYFDGDFTQYYKKFALNVDSDLQKISLKIQDVTSQINQLKATMSPDEITAVTQEGLKSLNEIEAAYKRHLNKSGKSFSKTYLENTTAMLDGYIPGQTTGKLGTAAKHYQSLVSRPQADRDSSWETEYEWLIKFVREYEHYLQKAGQDPTRDQQTIIDKYKTLYDSVKPMALNAENMLRNVVNMATNTPFVGMGGTGIESVQSKQAEDTGGKELASSQAEAQAEKEVAEATAKARAESEIKIQADRESAELAERERVAREAINKSAAQEQKVAIDAETNAVVETIKSYEELCQVVKRYNDLKLKQMSEKGVTGTEQKEINDIHARFQATRDSYTGPRTLDQEVNESIAQGSLFGNAFGTVNKDNIANYLGIEVPQAAAKANKSIDQLTQSLQEVQVADSAEVESQKTITSEIEQQNKLLLYRRVDGELDPSRIKSRSADNIANIQKTLESGFGGFGDGLYASTLSAAGDLVPAGSAPVSFFEFDASSYKLYVNKTSEQAELLSRFLLSLQKFVGAGTLLDESKLGNIESLNESQLFAKAQSIFKDFGMTQEQFSLWIENAKNEALLITSALSKGEAPSNMHNFGTRFMQTLGYDGVLNDTGNADYDGMYQGSVLYNPDISKIQAYLQSTQHVFYSVDDFLKYLEGLTSSNDNVNKVSDNVKAEKPSLSGGIAEINQETEALKRNTEAEKANNAEKEKSPEAVDAQQTNTNTSAINTNTAAIEKNTNAERINDTETIASSTIAGATSTPDTVTEMGVDANNLAALRLAIENIANNNQADTSNSPWALETTLQTVKGVLDAISGKLVQETKTIGTKVDGVTTTQSNVSKQTTKRGSISHGSASGEAGSPQKMFDYYYWLEEQMAQSQNNQRYTEALQKVYNSITPKIVAYNEKLLDSGQETPKWMSGLNEKHGLHMAQIQGGQEYSDSISVEQKTLDILKEEYKLRSDIFSLEQKGAIDSDLAPLREQLGIYESIRSTLEYNMTDDELTRYAVQATKVQGAGEYKSSVAEIKANIKARAEETKKATAEISASEKQEATALTNLKKLYQELGILQAKKQTSERGSAVAADLREQIKAKKDEISVAQTGHNFNQQLLEDERQLAYEKQQTANASKAAADADATSKQAELNKVKELRQLYAELGKQQAIMEAAEQGAKYDSAKSDYDTTFARIQSVGKTSSLDSTEEADIYRRAYVEQQRVIENEKKIAAEKKASADNTKAQSETEKQRKVALKEIEGLYKQLGKLDSKVMLAGSDAAAAPYRDEISDLEKVIALKSEELDIDQKQMNEARATTRRSSMRAAEATQARRDYDAELKAQVKKSREEANYNKAVSTRNSGNALLYDAFALDVNNVAQIDSVKNLSRELVNLKSIIDKIAGQGGVLQGDDAAQLNKARQGVAQYSAEVKGLIKNFDELSGENSKVVGQLDPTQDLYQQLVMVAKSAGAEIGKFDVSTDASGKKVGVLNAKVKSGANEFTNLAFAVRTADGAIVKTTGSITKVPSFLDQVVRKTKEISQYLVGSNAIYKVFNEIRKGIQYVRDIDLALTELKKVTSETDATYEHFLQTASQTAAKVGSTIQEVVSSTADFARLGYNLQDAAQMAENAQILMNVSEFTDIGTATDTLISAVQAFSYTADESLHVVDLMNVIGNNYAISTADLATSLTRSSAALVAAGNNMEQAAAMTAAANTIIQDADAVGKNYCRR